MAMVATPEEPPGFFDDLLHFEARAALRAEEEAAAREPAAGPLPSDALWRPRVLRRTEWGRLFAADEQPRPLGASASAGRLHAARRDAGGPLRVTVEVELEVRHRLSPQAEAGASDPGALLGALFDVTLSRRFRMSFVDALRRAQIMCKDAFERDKEAESLAQDFSLRLWLVFKFLVGLLRLRFTPRARPVFQAVVDAIAGEEAGAEGSVPAIVAQCLRCSAGLAPDVVPIQEAMRAKADALLRCLEGLVQALDARDGPSRTRLAGNLRQLGELLATRQSPSVGAPADWLAAVVRPLPCQVHLFRMTLADGGGALRVEARVALSDPLRRTEEVALRAAVARSARGCAAHALARLLGLRREVIVDPNVKEIVRECPDQKGFWVCSASIGHKMCRSLLEPVACPRPPAGLLAPRRLFGKGDQVYAFFNSNDHPWGYRYACVPGKPADLPVVGLTAGWLPATVVGGAEFDESVVEGSGHIVVRFDACFCDPFGPSFWSQRFFALSGRDREPQAFRGLARDVRDAYCESLEMRVPLALVRPRAEEPPVPEVSLLCFRWCDYWSHAWSDYNVASDGMLEDVFDGPCSLREQLPGGYEVVTAFVRHAGDLEEVDALGLASFMRGANRAAWYFLWPMRKEADYLPAGAIEERAFFAFVERMEQQGFRAAWPHRPKLYRMLCGKLWVSEMCHHSEYRVPPTVLVAAADLRRDARSCAERAWRALAELHQKVWGEPSAAVRDARGVVKLGFSWCGQDVLPFAGVESLAAQLETLLGRPGSLQTSCLVQLRVDAVVGELRVLCFRDAAQGGFRKALVWMYNGRPVPQEGDEGGEALEDFSVATSQAVPAAEVAAELLAGDGEAQRDAEAAAASLADRWLQWLGESSADALHCIRVDFLVAHAGRGTCSIWTCEVGECGASLCSVEVHARNAATLNDLLRGGAAGRPLVALPDVLPRNSGWKS